MTSRPNFTVTIENFRNPEAEKREVSYDATMLTIVGIPDDRSYGLAFMASGEMQIVPARYVKSIAFYPDGASWCPQCDGQLPGWLPKE